MLAEVAAQGNSDIADFPTLGSIWPLACQSHGELIQNVIKLLVHK